MRPLLVMQKVFFRGLVAALVAIFMLRCVGEPFRTEKGNRLTVSLRPFVGILGVTMNFWAIDHLPVADSTMLNKMSPFLAISMSLFILRRRSTKQGWFCLLVALAGAIPVIKSGIGPTLVPVLAGFFGGLYAGTVYTPVWEVGQGGAKGPVITFSFSVFSYITVLPLVFAGYEPMGAWQLASLLLSGRVTALGQLGTMVAYIYTLAREISAYDHIQVVFATLFGFLLLGELSDPLSVFGYVLIVGTAVYRPLTNKKII